MLNDVPATCILAGMTLTLAHDHEVQINTQQQLPDPIYKLLLCIVSTKGSR